MAQVKSPGREKTSKVKLALDITAQLNERLEAIAASRGITKSEAMRRALALYDAATSEVDRENKIGVFKDHGNGRSDVVKEFIGV